MVQCGICFLATGRESDDTAESIAPDVLRAWGEHSRQAVWAAHADQGLSVRVAYGLLHDGIPRNFLAKIGGVARDIPTYWAFGCHFPDAATTSEVLIRTEANAVRLQARGDRPRVLLDNLLRRLANVPSGHPPTVTGDDAAETPILLEATGGRTDAEPSASPIAASDGPKSVFCSYRHPNKAVPGSGRGRRLLRKLSKLLVADGWTVRLDERELQDGDSISGFIDQVRACAVFARDLDSRDTPSEPFTFREKFAGDGGAFADRTMTVAFPERGMPSDLKQAESVRECRTKFDASIGPAGDFSLAPRVYAEVYHLRSWSARLSELLAALNDRLNTPTAQAIADRLNRSHARLHPTR